MAEWEQDRPAPSQNFVWWGVAGMVGLCGCLMAVLGTAGIFVFVANGLSPVLAEERASVALAPTGVSGPSTRQEPTVAPTLMSEQSSSGPVSVEVGVVVDMPIMRSPHIDSEEAHDEYNSDPPTSGPHYGNEAGLSFYYKVLPDELLVHNLEHGHVVIYYRCDPPKFCDLVGELLPLYAELEREGYLIVVVPRPDMSHAVALTAWGKLAYLDQVDAEFITEFVKKYQTSDPEQEKMCGLQET